MSGYTEKEIITIVLVGSFITLLVVAFLVSFVYFYQRRHFAFLREKQEIQSRFQEELLRTQLEIQEETFKSISEEIHDNIGQTLSFIKLNLNTMDPGLTEREREKWLESKELLTKVIQELRSLSRTLNTDFIQQTGLVNAVRQQLSLLEKTGLYRVSLEEKGERRQLTANQQLVLYRVIQELMNNIVKHAEATAVRVSVDHGLEGVTIVVDDDGKGFEPAEASTGLGLRNIRNRISMINGSVGIRSSGDGTGTSIIITIPNNDRYAKI